MRNPDNGQRLKMLNSPSEMTPSERSLSEVGDGPVLLDHPRHKMLDPLARTLERRRGASRTVLENNVQERGTVLISDEVVDHWWESIVQDSDLNLDFLENSMSRNDSVQIGAGVLKRTSGRVTRLHHVSQSPSTAAMALAQAPLTLTAPESNSGQRLTPARPHAPKGPGQSLMSTDSGPEGPEGMMSPSSSGWPGGPGEMPPFGTTDGGGPLLPPGDKSEVECKPCIVNPPMPDTGNNNNIDVEHFLNEEYGSAWKNPNFDVSALIQALNDMVNVGDTLVYPANVTLYVKKIYVKANQKGQVTTLKLPDDAGEITSHEHFHSDPSGVNETKARGAPIFIIAAEHLSITGFVFDGNRNKMHTAFNWDNEVPYMLYSLIVAPILFTRMLIEDNTFQNAQYAAIYMRDLTDKNHWKGVKSFKDHYGIPMESLSKAWGRECEKCPPTSQAIDSVVIRYNKFINIQSHAVLVGNDYKHVQVEPDLTGGGKHELVFTGTFVFTNNESDSCGAKKYWKYDIQKKYWRQENLGDMLIMTGFKDVVICHNRTHDTGRFDYKLGPNNNYLVECNTCANAGWGMFELGNQTRHPDKNIPINVLAGTMQIRNNKYYADKKPRRMEEYNKTGFDDPPLKPTFVYLKGSAGGHKDSKPKTGVNHAYVKKILVEYNQINGVKGWIEDGVHVNPFARVERLEVENNGFLNLRRAAVWITLPYKVNAGDSMEPQPILPVVMVHYNGVKTDAMSERTTFNSLMHITGGGIPIVQLSLASNTIDGTRTGIIARADAAEELYLINNSFEQIGGAIPNTATYSPGVALGFPNCCSMKKLLVNGNTFYTWDYLQVRICGFWLTAGAKSYWWQNEWKETSGSDTATINKKDKDNLAASCKKAIDGYPQNLVCVTMPPGTS